MASCTILSYLLLFVWLYNLEATGGQQHENDALLKVISALLDKSDVDDVRNSLSKKQTSLVVLDKQNGNKFTGDKIRTAQRSYQRTEEREDVTELGKEEKILARELETFLHLKKERNEQQKKWLDDDGSARGTNTPEIVTTLPTMLPSSEERTTTTTTSATMTSTTLPRKCKVWVGWRYIYFNC